MEIESKNKRVLNNEKKVSREILSHRYKMRQRKKRERRRQRDRDSGITSEK